jgi:IgGFc binding protein
MSWGKKYESPVGPGKPKFDDEMNPFEISGFSCLAAEDNTNITLPDKRVVTLKMGESIYVNVTQSDQVTSNKPIQVVLLTADEYSTYQTRWFTMRALDDFKSSFVSPVGDSFANTKIVLYNPGALMVRHR